MFNSIGPGTDPCSFPQDLQQIQASPHRLIGSLGDHEHFVYGRKLLGNGEGLSPLLLVCGAGDRCIPSPLNPLAHACQFHHAPVLFH